MFLFVDSNIETGWKFLPALFDRPIVSPQITALHGRP